MKTKTRKGGTLISQIHQVCGRVWNALLRSEGLNDLEGARGRIIFSLWAQDCVPIKMLCEKTSLDKSTLTGIISRLERDGFIQRKPSKDDKRSVLICRTGKDKFFEEKVPSVSEKMNAIFYKGFSDAEIDSFELQLERILENCNNSIK